MQQSPRLLQFGIVSSAAGDRAHKICHEACFYNNEVEESRDIELENLHLFPNFQVFDIEASLRGLK